MVIAFAGQKGGSGKTTTAIAVAVELVRRGRRVLLVDADPQGSARTWAEVAGENGQPIPTVVAMGATMHKIDQLPRLAEAYDAVIVDTPPRMGDVQRSALMVANVVVLPCGPSAVDAWALTESVELVTKAQTLRTDLQPVGLITRKVANTAIGKGARQVLEQAGLNVLAAELHYRVGYQESLAVGKGPSTYEPESAAAQEVCALVEELNEMADCAKTQDLALEQKEIANG
jgi:chromosome partitioning protein